MSSPTLREAAWRIVAQDLTLEELKDARERFRRALHKSGERVTADDASGRLWTRWRWRQSLALAKTDPRFSFCMALPRSSLFGETVMRAAYDALGREVPSPVALDAARLVNIFVTCFDGICDETPDLLPVIVPATNSLFAEFPAAPDRTPDSKHPVVSLTFEAGLGAVALLRSAMTSDVQSDCVRKAVLAAYQEQLASLRLLGTSPGTVMSARSRLSEVTFEVSLVMAGVFGNVRGASLQRLTAAAKPLGDFFGWIDDVVDSERDASRSRPNMAVSLIDDGSNHSSDKEQTEVVACETQRRLGAMVEGLASLGLWNSAVDQRIRPAALAWLGFPPSMG